ncbi:hypothetical protein DFR58_14713 [Anaerobacterium chartisolvens]|uniref:Uncharacterized protein n=1 Tax=Anaerobacterium chartisolvens TaxID=1297424 RepID=A0A369AFH0_9FIRM|nr:hypothetical protein [Anaerobacterium chartisolvens]RCX07893.1 hypothetical protein DFR58_14713 [Anaerobacterium chartisolvens]
MMPESKDYKPRTEKSDCRCCTKDMHIGEQVTLVERGNGNEHIELEKAFALACRFLSDDIGCPAVDGDTNFPECSRGTDKCEDSKMWKCWQRYFIEKAKIEAVCRICGCTWNNACLGGCSWVKEDLCSACAS